MALPKAPKRKNCKKGYTCGGTCISRNKGCPSQLQADAQALSSQFKDLILQASGSSPEARVQSVYNSLRGLSGDAITEKIKGFFKDTGWDDETLDFIDIDSALLKKAMGEVFRGEDATATLNQLIAEVEEGGDIEQPTVPQRRTSREIIDSLTPGLQEVFGEDVVQTLSDLARRNQRGNEPAAVLDEFAAKIFNPMQEHFSIPREEADAFVANLETNRRTPQIRPLDLESEASQETLANLTEAVRLWGRLSDYDSLRAIGHTESGRAGADSINQLIGDRSEWSDLSTMAHELVHHAEYTASQDSRDTILEWRAASAIGQELQPIWGRKSELGFPVANNRNPYGWKFYSPSFVRSGPENTLSPIISTEIMTTWVQELTDPITAVDFLSRDPDHFLFGLGMAVKMANEKKL